MGYKDAGSTSGLENITASYVGDPMSSIGKSISASLLSNVWLVVLLILLTPFYVNILGIESYGLIGFYTSLVAILGILDMGISATATRELAWRSARPEEVKTIPVLLRSLEVVYWAIVFIIGMGMLALAWVFGADWFQTVALTQETVRDTLMLMAIALIVQMPSGLYSGGLIGLHRQVQNSTLLALFGTVRGVGAVFILWKVYPDVRVFFLWQILVSLLQVSVMRISLWRRVNPLKYVTHYSAVMINTIKGFAGGMILITALSLAVSQADKLILSRSVPLVDFGYYMLAWSVASGLMLVAMPLMQTYSPHFTRLISEGDEQSLAREVRLASQLMSVTVIPPAAFIIFLSRPILQTWLGNSVVADGAASVLTILAPGTMLIACAYPALYILYSRKQLKPVIFVQLVTLAIILPALVFGIMQYGIIGAALCWILFGIILYFSYQILGLRSLPNQGVFVSIFRDFIAPCAIAFLSAGIFGHWLSDINSKVFFVAWSIIALLLTWTATLFACVDLRLLISRKTNFIKVFSLSLLGK